MLSWDRFIFGDQGEGPEAKARITLNLKKKGRWRKDRLLTVPGSSCNLFRRAFQLGHGRVEMGDMREPILYKGEDGEYFWDTEAILTGIAKGFPIPPLVGLLLLGC